MIGRLLAQARQAVEPWYFACALLSFTTSGVVPILLPLEVHQDNASEMLVGIATAAIGGGMLTAPLWGRLASRRGYHRALMVLGALAIGGALVLFRSADLMIQWVPSAFLMGCGVASVFTVANVLIVDRFPPEECDVRIGWLQTFVSLGTVAGLAAAGIVSGLAEAQGFLVGVGTSAVAVLIALVATPAAPTREGPPDVHGASAPRPEWLTLSPHQLLYTPLGTLARRALARLPRAFALLLAVWFVSNLGMMGLTALYPLVMAHVFEVPPSASAFVLSAATAVSTALFVPAGNLCRRWSIRKVLSVGLLVRLAGLAALTALALSWVPGRGPESLLAFGIAQVAWPLLSVSSTLLVARLLPQESGGGMGLYNAMAALASLVGPVLVGHVSDIWSPDAVPAVAMGGVALGLLLMVPLMRAEPPAAQGAEPPAAQGAEPPPAQTS